MHGVLRLLLSAVIGVWVVLGVAVIANGRLGLLVSAVIGVEESPSTTASPVPTPAAVPVAKAPELDSRKIWRLSLPDALRISLDHTEFAQVIYFCEGEPVRVSGWPRLEGDERDDGTSPIDIVQVNPDIDSLRFKSEVMAHLRSVEQQYWSLVQQYAQLKGSEIAVAAAKNVVTCEGYDLHSNRRAEAAEAWQRLEQFQLALVAKTEDVAKTESQLRKIMGRALDDRRRIVPISAAVEEQAEPDWDECLATMMDRQPDIVRQREVVHTAEMNTLNAIDYEMEAAVFGSLASWREAAKQTQDAFITEQQQRAFLTQVVQRTTHSLARFFLEIDANDKQFQAAARVPEASLKRLDAQRVFYEEGRIFADRYLAAVSQYVGAVAQVAQFKTSYNNALVALEEAKGTLLSARDIAVTEARIEFHDGRVFDPKQHFKVSRDGVRAN